MIRNLKKKMLLTIMIFVTIIVAAFSGLVNFIPMQRSYSEAISFLEHNIIPPAANNSANNTDGNAANRSVDATAGNIRGQSPKNIQPPSSPLFHSNILNIHLDADGNIKSWSSNRSDLYDDASAAELTEKILSRSRPEGIMSDYYYVCRTFKDGTEISMLDAHFALKSLRTTLIISVVSGIFAWFMFLFLGIYLVDHMTQPISDAFSRQRQFISDAGHELKSPVAVICANADVLGKEIGDNKWLSYIKTETSRMSKLIEGLMTLAQIDDDDKITEKAMINLSQTVLGAALPMESMAFENGTVMEFDVQPDIHMNANKEQIEQLIVILLGNAIKYGQEKGFIKLFMVQQHKSIVLTVFNTGIGIRPEDTDRIFDRFYRVEKERSRSSGSYGLGLSIARSIVEEHRGTICAESNYGENVTFRVVFPAI